MNEKKIDLMLRGLRMLIKCETRLLPEVRQEYVKEITEALNPTKQAMEYEKSI